ncbi:MAG: CBS domain-containing protein [Betaproteobacteria bacterium]|nr:CBS domain-containing protein [Betaproteobacteria bacterium]
MPTVKHCLEQKPRAVHSVQSSDSVHSALLQMRGNRVRAMLVIDNGHLVGIISQGDCAMKVLLPGLDAKVTLVSSVMTANPLAVSPSDDLDHCMGIMATRHIRHLPVKEGETVVGVVSVGDIVNNVIEQQGHQIKYLETYIRGHGA